MSAQTSSRPTALSVTDRTNFVSLGADRLTVTYFGHGAHPHDVGAVRANAPFAGDAAVHYFEMEILDTGVRR